MDQGARGALPAGDHGGTELEKIFGLIRDRSALGRIAVGRAGLPQIPSPLPSVLAGLVSEEAWQKSSNPFAINDTSAQEIVTSLRR